MVKFMQIRSYSPTQWLDSSTMEIFVCVNYLVFYTNMQVDLGLYREFIANNDI